MARDTYDSDGSYLNGPLDQTGDYLARKEGLLLTPKWDRTHDRVGYGSSTTTDASGRVSEVTPETRITERDARRDLRRREFETQAGIIDQIGSEAWFRMTPEAQTALTDIAYNYGSLARLPSVVRAAQTGDPVHLAQVIAARGVDNSGINQNRRLDEAYTVLAGGEGGFDQPQQSASKAKRKGFSWAEMPAEAQAAPSETPKQDESYLHEMARRGKRVISHDLPYLA